MDKLLFVQEAANRVGIHHSTVRQWCYRGLPHTRNQYGHRLITERDLLEYARARGVLKDADS